MNRIEVYESQIRQLFASVVWTHKIQEKQADIYRSRYSLLEFVRIGTMTITTSGIFSIVFIDKYWLKVATAIVGFITLFVNIYYETYDLRQMTETHKGSAKDLLKLRESLITLLTEIKVTLLSEDEIKKKMDDVYSEYFGILEGMKDASSKAVSNASKALKEREDNTFTDDEINSYLPIGLRK